MKTPVFAVMMFSGGLISFFSFCAMADPLPNTKERLVGRTLTCGDSILRFGPKGQVDIFIGGNKSGFSTDERHVSFNIRQIIIMPKGAQDSFTVDYRFGKYYIGDDQCVVR